MTLRVEIGVFAHNEAVGIAQTPRSLMAQDLFQSAQVRLVVLANGCAGG